MATDPDDSGCTASKVTLAPPTQEAWEASDGRCRSSSQIPSSTFNNTIPWLIALMPLGWALLLVALVNGAGLNFKGFALAPAVLYWTLSLPVALIMLQIGSLGALVLSAAILLYWIFSYAIGTIDTLLIRRRGYKFKLNETFWLMVLVPVYLYRRAKTLRQPLSYFWLSMVPILLVISSAFSGIPQLSVVLDNPLQNAAPAQRPSR